MARKRGSGMRSIWKGALSFGLVNIPIEMYSASQEHEFKFVMLHKPDLSEIRYARICKKEEKEVPWDEIVKGFENEKGEYVILTEEDFKKALMAKSKAIEILQFVDESEIDSIYFEKPYILQPQKGADKAYTLLAAALQKSGKVGIGKFTLHNHERLGVIKYDQNALILIQLRYESQMIDFSKFPIPQVKKIDPKEMEIALKLIDHMTQAFRPEQFQDSYTEDMKLIIKQKEKGRKTYEKPAAAPSEKIHDIMSLLKASLDKTEKKPRKSKKKIA